MPNPYPPISWRSREIRGASFHRLVAGTWVSTEREEGTKENRADPFAAQCEHGFVKMVEGSWNRAFVEELCAFPNGGHDDQVDAASAAFRVLCGRRPLEVY